MEFLSFWDQSEAKSNHEGKPQASSMILFIIIIYPGVSTDQKLCKGRPAAEEKWSRRKNSQMTAPQRYSVELDQDRWIVLLR